MSPHRQLHPIDSVNDIPKAFQGTPAGLLIEYHNLGRSPEKYTSAPLLVGMCMDHRKRLNIPENFAYTIRTGGANLKNLEFYISFAIAVGGIKEIALIGHNHCGMVNLGQREEQFIKGLAERAGWESRNAKDHFKQSAPKHEIGDEIRFILEQTAYLKSQYPKIPVAPLLYNIEDNRLYWIKDTV